MDLFIVQLDGIDVAITDSETAALDHARRIAAEELTLEARVLRVRDRSTEVLPPIAVAEAAIE